MTTPAPRTSLIIVSRHRTAGLMRALAGVAQLDHPAVEVIVVADPNAAAAVRAATLPVKLAVFDVANISAARNIGLGLAAAPVVAFLDDDAVPEPTWLSRLTAPFGNPDVTAAAGFTLGRSGLAWQWRAMRVDARGLDTPLDAPQSSSLHGGTAQSAVKTPGTNCAFRRDRLLAIGGFDDSLRFYLDEADVNLRLAAIGGLTAIVPDAVVHHGFAASARRRADRVPTDLSDIAASLSLFLRRHAPSDRDTTLARHEKHQQARLMRHMISGAIEPRDVVGLMTTWRDGLAQAKTRALPCLAPIPATATGFAPLPGTGPRAGSVVSGPAHAREHLEAAAKTARQQGLITTLICLSPGPRAHQHRFRPDGIWEQTGGQYGRAFRTGPRLIFAPMHARLTQEIARLSALRPTGPLP